MLSKEREAASVARAAHADSAVKLAAMEERCSQQQEAMRYMRADVQARVQAIDALEARLAKVTHDAQIFGQATARAEATLQQMQQVKRYPLLFQASGRLVAGQRTKTRAE